MLSIVFGELGLLAALILTVLAWKGWSRIKRQELPGWRRCLSLSALLLLSVNLAGIVALEAPVLIVPVHPRPEFLQEILLTLSHPLDIVIVVFALTLRGRSRLQAVSATFLVLICWPLGYV